MHLLRSTDGRKSVNQRTKISDALTQAVADLTGSSLPTSAYDQAMLPIAFGGLGVKDPLKLQPFARIAALAGFEREGRSLVGAPEMAFAKPPADLETVLLSLKESLGPHSEPIQAWLAHPTQMSVATKKECLQGWWADQFNALEAKRLLNHGAVRDQARIRCQQGPSAYGWLQVLPNSACRTSFSNRDYTSLLRSWLGLPLFFAPSDTFKCPACGDQADAFGDHFVCCTRNGGTERHTAVREELVNVCLAGSIPVEKEQGCFNLTRDADLLFRGWKKGGPLAVDITVTHPMAPSTWPLSLDKVSSCLAKAEAAKAKAAEDRCAKAGWSYMGAAFTPWGAPGPQAKTLLFELTK